MTANGKKSKSFRLTSTAIEMLETISEASGISPTATLEIIIREAAQKREDENKKQAKRLWGADS